MPGPWRARSRRGWRWCGRGCRRGPARPGAARRAAARSPTRGSRAGRGAGRAASRIGTWPGPRGSARGRASSVAETIGSSGAKTPVGNASWRLPKSVPPACVERRRQRASGGARGGGQRGAAHRARERIGFGGPARGERFVAGQPRDGHRLARAGDGPQAVTGQAPGRGLVVADVREGHQAAVAGALCLEPVHRPPDGGYHLARERRPTASLRVLAERPQRLAEAVVLARARDEEPVGALPASEEAQVLTGLLVQADEVEHPRDHGRVAQPEGVVLELVDRLHPVPVGEPVAGHGRVDEARDVGVLHDALRQPQRQRAAHERAPARHGGRAHRGRRRGGERARTPSRARARVSRAPRSPAAPALAGAGRSGSRRARTPYRVEGVTDPPSGRSSSVRRTPAAAPREEVHGAPVAHQRTP